MVIISMMVLYNASIIVEYGMIEEDQSFLIHQ